MPLITKNKFIFTAIFICASVGPILLTVSLAQRGDTVAEQPTSAETMSVANR